MQYYIKNWSEFQHFKDRCPPWIKLYRHILDDPEWFALSGEDTKVLVMLWLLASEDKTGKGYLPDINTISFRLRVDINTISDTLSRLSSWVYKDDNSLISEGYQDDTPETERETEKEIEKETEIEGKKKAEDLFPPEPELPNPPKPEPKTKASKIFVKPTAKQIEEYAKSIRFDLEGGRFIDSYESKDWMIGKNRMKDWKAAVRTWKRMDNDRNHPKHKTLHPNAQRGIERFCSEDEGEVIL